MNDALFATGHIAFWLLLIGLFFPRLALFAAWIGFYPYPANPLPDLVNFICWLFFPRFLIAFYVYVDLGMHNIWFWAYLATGIAGFFGESHYVRRRVIRRRTVTRDGNGNTVTTVEEEEV